MIHRIFFFFSLVVDVFVLIYCIMLKWSIIPVSINLAHEKYSDFNVFEMENAVELNETNNEIEEKNERTN